MIQTDHVGCSSTFLVLTVWRVKKYSNMDSKSLMMMDKGATITS
jgi:hypothetical protein